MTTFFTSDLHFGHKNVLIYCNRPYKDLEEMHAAIIKYWNETVKPDDEIYILGDFSLSPKWSGLLIPQLNGIKYLISGNHDATFPWKNREKYLRMIERYKREGWKEVYLTKQLKLKNDRTVLLSHLPYKPKDNDQYNTDIRYLDYRPDNKGLTMLHGHLHRKYVKYNNMIDVGFDGHLKFYSEDDIIKLIEDKRDYIPSELTEFYKTREYKE